MSVKYKFLIGCVVFALLGAVYYLGACADNEYLRVSMLNVGQGDAILVTDPNGFQILIDAGPDDGVVQALESVVPLYDKSLDMLIVTHPDADHIGGVSSVLDVYRVYQVADNRVAKDTDTALRARADEQDEVAEVRALYAGDRMDLPSGVTIEVLHPSVGYTSEEVNNYSTVLKLSYGSISYLFTGDMDSSVESSLLQRYGADSLDVSVLKIPHHGSRFSSSLEFLKVVRPEMGIVSFACKNSYGHPSTQAVDRYNYLNIPVYTTCDRGTFSVVTDGATLWVQNEYPSLFVKGLYRLFR